MEFMDVVRRRCGIRKYKRDPFPEEGLKHILEAARLAPSGGNRQPWRFVVVKEKAIKDRMGEAANNQTWIADAPVVIVGCWVTIPEVPLVRCVRDTAIAFEHIILAATNEGLATRNSLCHDTCNDRYHDILAKEAMFWAYLWMVWWDLSL